MFNKPLRKNIKALEKFDFLKSKSIYKGILANEPSMKRQAAAHKSMQKPKHENGLRCLYKNYIPNLKPPVHVTLQERMLPNAEKVSYSALLSIDLSRFLMNTLPTPDFLREGSLWDHMILIGFPLTTSKFMVSKALSAGGRRGRERKGHECVYVKPQSTELYAVSCVITKLTWWCVLSLSSHTLYVRRHL